MKRILLQKRELHLYAGKGSTWTPEVKEATQFDSVLEALSFARSVPDPGLDVLMDFGNPKFDIRLKVKD
jgi:hypothetical protein